MKVAIPTDDGIMVALDFENASKFLVADISPGKIGRRTMRTNPALSFPTKKVKLSAPSSVYCAEIAHKLSDCRAAIAMLISDEMRYALERLGIDVIVSFEPLVDRVLALFAVGALKDIRRFYESLLAEEVVNIPETPDVKEFDG